ncbi:hypothetical protein F4861DRAFT_136809 [Xylaria intraflava]|nr:hypothetical protein F4861DRAFT_136809 [Xylaria intraflava]
MISNPATAIDPPRPAREGCEWVWFPAGYWAEREIVEMPPKGSPKPFRWRKRSGKSSPESAKHSPQTTQSPLASSTLSERTGRSSVQAMTPRSRPQTNTSSESGGSPFTVNRLSDPHASSPYLSEEAHVQSLQWPSLEPTARKGSWVGGPNYKQPLTHSSSPLHLSNTEAEVDSDEFSTVGGQAPADVSANIIYPDLTTAGTSTSQAIAKKSFINWRMLAEHLQRSKKAQASSDEGTVMAISPAKSSPPTNPGMSLARKGSLKSNKSKLFSRSRWHRKVSSSSEASTSSVRNSLRSPPSCSTPVSLEGGTSVDSWASDFPGNEARRVQTPHIMTAAMDRFPRSFFSKSPSVARHQPASSQEGHASAKKTHLSTSFTPVDSSSSTTPRPRPANTGGEKRASKNNGIKAGDGQSVASTGSEPEETSKAPTHQEWWEVPVSALRPHEAAKQRHMHAAMAADTQRSFQFDFPEHLPTSPMCPANKRHKSGGTGVCVYHGRAKRTRTTPHTPGEDPPKPGEARDGGRSDNSHEDSSETGSDIWK